MGVLVYHYSIIILFDSKSPKECGAGLTCNATKSGAACPMHMEILSSDTPSFHLTSYIYESLVVKAFVQILFEGF